MGHQTIKDLTKAEHLLWKRVDELWQYSLKRDFLTIQKAIHPNYSGWDATSVVPHDRSYAVRSATDESGRLLSYELFLLRSTIYESHVGIVNYRYTARLEDQKKNIRSIKGRSTEIFLRKDNLWILIGLHGEPEPIKIIQSVDIYK
jgi:hypothetical protein